MSDEVDADAILARFRGTLNDLYGTRLERVVLYGSRARRDHRPDSDFDIAVFIDHPGTFSEDCAHLADIGTDILLGTDAVISATPFRAGAWRARTGFMRELGRDGRDL